MKKYLLTLLLVAQPIFSELVLEITKGSDNPYSVALINFNGSNSAKYQVTSIVKNDLDRTGEFRILENNKLLSIPSSEEELNYSDFKLLGVDFIVMGSVAEEDISNIAATYKVFSVKKESQIRTSTVYGVPNKIRQLSHYISDGIYEEITGLQGVASTRLLYVTEERSKDRSMFKLIVADADGSNEQILLRSSEPIISPSWSPDSKQVAYVSFETGMAKVFTQYIATGKREIVLENQSQISSPSWSPNGKYLSLTMYQDGNAEIYILNLKNKNLTRLTNHYSIDTESSWSPNGSKVIFTSGRSGSPQLYEINLRKFNAKPKRVTFEGNYNAKGSYLPNGEGFIFVHRKENNFQIALKYFNENFVRPLTNSKLDESPSISPNGNVVVYAISENETGLLAGVTLSGARFRLPIQKGEVREPSWSGFLR
ncbi:Tol-Pal system beta propeller repeat protein TolB [Gammaproteobacteria bacterium]|nr:Tol-Pal system beta propeller repeat protein TolB [Gammaproteobacteria bacterium]